VGRADDPIEEARAREREETERLQEAKEQADETLDRAEELLREAEEREAPSVEPDDARAREGGASNG